MQTLEFSKNKKHWFGSLFCFDSVRGVTTVCLSVTFLKLRTLWKVIFPWDGFKWLTYFEVRGYLLSNHFRFAVNTFFMDYDSKAEKKLVVYHKFW